MSTVIWQFVITLPHVWGAKWLRYFNMINGLRESGSWQLSDKIMVICITTGFLVHVVRNRELQQGNNTLKITFATWQNISKEITEMLNAVQQIFLYWGRKKTEVSWSELFSDTNLRWSCLALHLLSAVTTLIYYGGLLNVQNLGQHLHFNTVMAGTASSN